MKLYRLDLSTFIQGSMAGLLNTFTLFQLNKYSLTMASTLSAVYVLGTVSSGFIGKFKESYLKYFSFLIRSLALSLTIFIGSNPFILIMIICNSFLLAMVSRRQFIDLKNLVSKIDSSHLTKHGAMNAIGFGISSMLAGILFTSNHLIFYIPAFIMIIIGTILYPESEATDIDENAGLSRRDVFVAVFFTVGITPISNTLGILIFTRIFNEKIAGILALTYTLGSLIAKRLRDAMVNSFRPIGMAVMISSIFFYISILTKSVHLSIILRFLTGALLFSAQGILEERSKRDLNTDKGINFLWTLFSLVSFISIILLTQISQHFGYSYLPILSFISSLIIISLKLIIK